MLYSLTAFDKGRGIEGCFCYRMQHIPAAIVSPPMGPPPSTTSLTVLRFRMFAAVRIDAEAPTIFSFEKRTYRRVWKCACARVLIFAGEGAGEFRVVATSRGRLVILRLSIAETPPRTPTYLRGREKSSRLLLRNPPSQEAPPRRRAIFVLLLGLAPPRDFGVMGLVCSVPAFAARRAEIRGQARHRSNIQPPLETF